MLLMLLLLMLLLELLELLQFSVFRWRFPSIIVNCLRRALRDKAVDHVLGLRLLLRAEVLFFRVLVAADEHDGKHLLIAPV
jgi:hypothetical protein